MGHNSLPNRLISVLGVSKCWECEEPGVLTKGKLRGQRRLTFCSGYCLCHTCKRKGCELEEEKGEFPEPFAVYSVLYGSGEPSIQDFDNDFVPPLVFDDEDCVMIECEVESFSVCPVLDPIASPVSRPERSKATTPKAARSVTLPLEPVLSMSNKYSALCNEERLTNGVPIGRTWKWPVTNSRKDHFANVAHRHWLRKCLVRKMYLKSLPLPKFVRRSVAKPGCIISRCLPETVDGLTRFFWNWMGPIRVSPAKFLHFASELSKFHCPVNGLFIDYDPSDCGVRFGQSTTGGLSVRYSGREVQHRGDEDNDWRSVAESVVLSSPASISEVKSHHRRISLSIKNDTFDYRQQVIDSIPRHSNWKAKTGALDLDTLSARLRLSFTVEPKKMDPTILFGIAYAYKFMYGCPPNRVELNFDRFKDKMFASFDEPTNLQPGGLYFKIDNAFYFHCGPLEQTRAKMNLWKLAAKSLLEGKTRKESIVRHQRALSETVCSNPWFSHQLLGFRVCANVGTHTVFARGLDFSREDDRPGRSDSLLTVRQYKTFWSIGDKTLVFTMKGLAKLFYRKASVADEKWRFAIAEHIGLTLEEAYKFFSYFANDQNTPDLVFRKTGSEPNGIAKVEKVRTVFIEVTSGGEKETNNKNVGEGTTSVPPPPPAPSKPASSTEGIERKEKANGNTWLLKPGNDGKSNRSLFRSTYPNDWWSRISRDACSAMNADLAGEPGFYSKTWSSDNLIFSPDEDFDIHSVRTSRPSNVTPRLARSSSGDVSSLFGAIKSPPKLKKTVTVEKNGDHLGKVLEFAPPKVHKNGRDSTISDIETNPGPIGRKSSDELLFHHPSPAGPWRQTIVGHHLSTEEGSPLESNFRLVEPTPKLGGVSPTEVSPVEGALAVPTPGVSRRSSLSSTASTSNSYDVFFREMFDNIDGLEQDVYKLYQTARDSTMADIEQNPGPDRGRSFSEDDKGKGKQVQRGRSKSAGGLDSTLSAFGVQRKTTEGELAMSFGISPSSTFGCFEASGFLAKYENHRVVSHLPSDSDWWIEQPGWGDGAFIRELQSSLDKLSGYAKHNLKRGDVEKVLSMINTFFQKKSNRDKRITKYTISALAHIVKASWDCPSDALAISFHNQGRQIVLHWSDDPVDEVRDKLYWVLGNSKVVHGGFDHASAVLHARQRRAKWSDFVSSFSQYEPSDCLVESNPFIDDLLTNNSLFSRVKRLDHLTPDSIVAFCFGYLEFWFIYIINYYHSFLYPTVLENPELMTEGGEIPWIEGAKNGNISDSLLVATFGTRGDRIPPRYYARLASTFGVRTHVHDYYCMGLDALQRMYEGDMEPMLPSYSRLTQAVNLGYKRVFTPHVEVGLFEGASYNLSPSENWIRRITFSRSFKEISSKFWLPVFMANTITGLMQHTWRVGAMRDSGLPRSHDGVHLLEKKENTGQYEEGWCCGSDLVDVIPLGVRDSCPRIPDGNHQDIFRRYKKIHMHGGAGSVQTALAAGAEVVIHSPYLDRDYHTVPSPSDFRQPSVGPFLGWLVFSGFKTTLPFNVKILVLIMYIWSIKFSLFAKLLFWGLKAFAIGSYFYTHWMYLLILYFTIPTIIARLALEKLGVYRIVKTLAVTLWKFPLLCLANSMSGTIVGLWCIKKIFDTAVSDYNANHKESLSLVFEPVTRFGIQFPWPFGHYCFSNLETQDVFEGVFVNGQQQEVGGLFKMVKRRRALKQGAKTYKFNIGKALLYRMIDEPAQEYSATHNCVTMVGRVALWQSLTGTIFLGSVFIMVWLSLQSSEFLVSIINFLTPGVQPKDSFLYKSLGFAAGIERIPIEPEDLALQETQEFLQGDQSPPQEEIDFSKEQTLEAFIAELSCIENNLKGKSSLLDDEDMHEVSMRTFDKTISDLQFPDDALINIEPIPPYVKHTWAELVDNLHHAISFIRRSELVSSWIAWLKTVSSNIYVFIRPILLSLSYFLNLAFQHSSDAFRRLFNAGCAFLDYAWGLEASKRVKTVWGLTGLYRTGMLGVKARLAASIAFSEFYGRTDFESDYNRFVQEAKDLAKQYGAQKRRQLGGPQRRPIGYSKPLMSEQEAKLLDFKPGEYEHDVEYQQRIDQYHTQGIKQGGDGVFLADKMPELIAKSQHRYEPRYPVLTSDDRQLAKEIAQAMFDQYPEVFADAGVLPPRAVHNYVKQKYSPGTPFVNGNCFKSRQAMFDAGYDKVMQKKALHYLQTGEYPVQFYHAFVKSQVVDIKKCLPPESGGTNKDVRTVVSQDLFSYYVDQCLQIERNKRLNWETYGAGIGMPLNQSMEKIYSKMADHQKERGGRYIIMDATAFDSICKPILFEINGCLWDLGFKDHPSGNGKNLASVLRASYSARQNAWIIGVTEPEYDSLTVCIKDKSLRKLVEQRNLDTIVPLARLVNWSEFNKLKTHDEKRKYVAQIKVPEGKTVLTWDPSLRPNRSNWMGNFEYGDINEAQKQFHEHHTLTYAPGNFDAMYQDIKAIAGSNYKLLSNVHPKNRGGSTGGSDTSNVNTHAFKAGVIWAWCKTTGQPPREFFKYNTIANTSDDTIWQSGGEHGLNTVQDVAIFQKHCMEVGINLEIETTKNITQVEYLSKFVRVPTAEDSAALRLWRAQKIKAISSTQASRGLPVPETYEQLNNPRFVVVQNPSAILLRRSAFRYYQSSFDKWRYTSIERGAGHANNTAFVPELYNRFAMEWCDDVNLLLEKHHIHRKYRFNSNSQFGLAAVEQVDPRASQQALSPRQQAFLRWLKGNMFPSYYRVIDTHMNVAKIDPEQHAKFLKKLEKGWYGYEQIMRDGVDGLFAATDAIPDEWSKKFQPSIEMLYAEIPFYTKNKIVEKFVYTSLLKEHKEDEITFGDFSSRLRESPYAGVCDPYHFWEQLSDADFKASLLSEDPLQYKGLVMCISAIYMLTSWAEWFLIGLPFIGILYKLFIWSFIGLNKVYGILNTIYWHSTGKSSREISRMMPRDPYITSKRFCAFIVDFFPLIWGHFMLIPSLILDCFPPCLELLGKTWFEGQSIKAVERQEVGQTSNINNPWSAYAHEYVEKLRQSKTNRAYIGAKTGTGKSSMFIAALWETRHRTRIRKIWLIEPRKVLRDQTEIPFGIPSQRLSKGISQQGNVDIYICTYGHFQSRLMEVDLEQDIVLFDEFHEQQGEMILGLHTCKAPIFLLSATPAEIPQLHGSPMLMPNIDRRFPITVHKVDDTMDVADMFMEARNHYPELCDRALIIVPTVKMVHLVINQLNDLKVGRVSPLTRTERDVADSGIIVATPYVQTGLDIKPPPKILVDSGKDVKINKGVMVHPLPWTDKDMNKQRVGRVGRLQSGVVYQPKSAGSGSRTITYPSPSLFADEVVAKHFNIPALTPFGGALIKEMPYYGINQESIPDLQTQKSVTLIHALSLHGIRQTEWQKFYTLKLEGKNLGDDYEFVDRVCDSSRWITKKLLPWSETLYHLHREKVTCYSINGEVRWSKPITCKNDQWVQLEESPEDHIKYETYDSKHFDSKFVAVQEQIEKLKEGIISQASQVSPHNLQHILNVLR
ncbi:MAG: polyprotein [Apis hypovirus 2]|nr:MAG: polyprotein [Apis hypovirus 2]